eukprot:198517_1
MWNYYDNIQRPQQDTEKIQCCGCGKVCTTTGGLTKHQNTCRQYKDVFINKYYDKESTNNSSESIATEYECPALNCDKIYKSEHTLTNHKVSCIKYKNQQIQQLKDQLQTTQTELKNTQNGYTTLSQINYKLKNENQLLINENIKLKQQSKAFKSAFLSGGKPRFQLVSINKRNDNIARSDTVHKWMQQRKETFGDIIVDKHQQPLSKHFRNELENYVRNNKTQSLHNPFISFNNQLPILQSDTIEIFKIGNNHRIKLLKGEKGVRAKIKIPKLTVIGRYVGFECTDFEWNEIYDYSNADPIHSQYLYTLKWTEYIHNGIAVKRTGKNKCSKVSRVVTIDPMAGGFKKYPLIFINDCRKNIRLALTNEDKQYQNCAFLDARIYGWPCAFIVTIRDIDIGEELLLDYGEDYGKIVMENKRWNQIINHQKQNITQEISANSNNKKLNDDTVIDAVTYFTQTQDSQHSQ